MTSEGLGEMFEGDSADMCAEKFPLMLMGGRAEVLAYADPGPRTPVGFSGNFALFPKIISVLITFETFNTLTNTHLVLYFILSRGSKSKLVSTNEITSNINQDNKSQAATFVADGRTT